MSRGDKFLSRVLRHEPELAEMSLRPAGLFQSSSLAIARMTSVAPAPMAN